MEEIVVSVILAALGVLVMGKALNWVLNHVEKKES